MNLPNKLTLMRCALVPVFLALLVLPEDMYVACLGAAFSLLEGTGPLSKDEAYADHLDFTSDCLKKMARIGGPRCCKRNAFLVLEEAIAHANSRFGVEFSIKGPIVCDYFSRNPDCKRNGCPYFPKRSE